MKLTQISLAVATALSISSVAMSSVAIADEAPTDLKQNIERITVTGDFRSRGIEDVAASVSVLSAHDLNNRAAAHIESALMMAPNVNLAAGASRASFVQIRGIGERSQFVDPINPSVGLVIDGINYSGLGAAGTLFDIGQVEVFRGPQSTRFGADAMAGMIYLQSEEATYAPSGQFETMWANYNSYAAGVAFGNRVTNNLAVRGSLYSNVSDGFIENIHLNREDTQDIDELTLRLNATWDVSDDWHLQLTYHRFDIDNGYDAFSLDRNRQTLSDTPGRDTLDSHAGRVAATFTGAEGYELQLFASYLQADSEYSFDEDWAFEGIRPELEYNSFDAYFRERDQLELESRVLSAAPVSVFGVDTDWLVGAYFQKRQQDLTREYTYLDVPFASTYDTERTAIYAELQQALTDRLRLTYGLRWERYSNEYLDSRSIAAAPSDSALGGRASLEYSLAPMQQAYASLTRGFKGGGVNGEALGRVEDRNLEEHREFLESRATFAPEYLTSAEIGYKAFLPEHNLRVHLNAFYSWRDDMQVNAYVERSAVFVSYLDNASDGKNYGLEAQFDYLPSDSVRVFLNLGWLATELNNLVLQDGTNLAGRDQAHAPSYQVNLGSELLLREGLTLRIEMDARDKFYYSNSHDEQSDSYQLFHARLNYQLQNWEFSLWARNLFDKDYTTRGFFFGNDPRKDYAPENYVQYGEPRRVGVTARYRF
ncbi:hypothetical protein CWE08_10490 [Aliidiomarina iranensis]|uniref:TonB-dependent receptor n=1 Tax=Aliidiomarina iranensis TaxID=1434071 RepID=A0A432VRY0_9GAMM|nr:TonB-dependent receptor [Aliidiomarina iranensis]RUO18979.1 hypothetical protein CWE08_10490 [Aliidiomarina iranensis]